MSWVFSSTGSAHLVGWVVVWDIGKRHDIRKICESGLAHFMGEYGNKKDILVKEETAIGIRIPEMALPLTTWSLYEENSSFCFITGIFYDKYKKHYPVNGEDKELAKLVLNSFRNEGERAIVQLNGSFSGVVWDGESQALITFIDRLGVGVVYWTKNKNIIFTSSNLASLRAFRNFEFDPVSVFQFITLGFPVGERTLFKDVFIQKPCTYNIFKDDNLERKRYYTIPKRTKEKSVKESARFLAETMKNTLTRIASRAKAPLYLALSGGHDSRVILNGLLNSGVDFEILHWEQEDFNSRIVRELSCMIKKPIHLVPKSYDLVEIEEVHKYGFLYTLRECILPIQCFLSWGKHAEKKEEIS